MRFRVDPNPEETQRACQAIVTASLPPSRTNAIMIGLYVAVVAAAVTLPVSRPVTIIIGVGAVLATVKLLHLDARARTRGLQAADPHAAEPHFIELGAGGLRTWCAHVDTRYTWDGTTGVRETSEFFLFLRGSGGGVAVPKRLLADGQEAELRARVREWLPEHADDLG